MKTFAPLYLRGWSAWGPPLPDKQAWVAWLPECALPPGPGLQAQPACKGVPPLMRRRFSLTSRMMVETALAACAEAGLKAADTHLVYGTCSGEIEALGKLLAELSVDEQLSPMAFSVSVHHVPTGHFSMTTKHKGVSRTLSAFDDTFSACFLETASLLQRMPQLPALVCLADENLPRPFELLLVPPPFPFGLSLIVAAEGDPAQAFTFSYAGSPAPDPEEGGIQAFAFLRWWISGAPELRLQTGMGEMLWRRL